MSVNIIDTARVYFVSDKSTGGREVKTGSKILALLCVHIFIAMTVSPVALCADKGASLTVQYKYDDVLYEGQLDFCSDICIGDTVVFTDASGARYEYTLERVNMMGSLDAQKEYSSGDDLTVFAKDSYFNEYTVLHLKLK